MTSTFPPSRIKLIEGDYKPQKNNKYLKLFLTLLNSLKKDQSLQAKTKILENPQIREALLQLASEIELQTYSINFIIISTILLINLEVWSDLNESTKKEIKLKVLEFLNTIEQPDEGNISQTPEQLRREIEQEIITYILKQRIQYEKQHGIETTVSGSKEAELLTALEYAKQNAHKSGEFQGLSGLFDTEDIPTGKAIKALRG